MGKKVETRKRSKTLPSSPTHSSSSSSDFEFRISLSPCKSSAALCPADELFYKGKLLPLHLSPRISMVRLLASASTSSSATETTTTVSRDSSSSTDSTSSSFIGDLSLSLLAPGDPDSSRPSSVTDDDLGPNSKKPLSFSSKYFSLSRIFKKDLPKEGSTTAKKMSSSAKDVFRKYLKKVKPLYEKLSQKQQQQQQGRGERVLAKGGERITDDAKTTTNRAEMRQSGFSGNLKTSSSRVTRRSYVASCPSSMRSSPSHSGVLSGAGMPPPPPPCRASSSSSSYLSEVSTMEELQNAIQGAIAHCKSSMMQQQNSSTTVRVNGNNVDRKCKAVAEIY